MPRGTSYPFHATETITLGQLLLIVRPLLVKAVALAF
jgi:hypothetical protein